MVRRLEAGSDDALGALVGRAAIGAVAATLLLLALGFAAELLRRRHRARRVLALLDLTVPIGVRTVVIAVLALVASFSGPRPAGAADSVRGWLGQASTSTTVTTRVAVATPGSVSEHEASPPTTVPGPVVLIPPVTVERLNPSPPVPSPVMPAVALPAYVVKRGDCLWSIAAGLLGAHADARSIDTAWRQIYAANRAAIGDDPNLIHIGLNLELPPLSSQP
jgi:nucleoid-associated protein YgaU